VEVIVSLPPRLSMARVELSIDGRSPQSANVQASEGSQRGVARFEVPASIARGTGSFRVAASNCEGALNDVSLREPSILMVTRRKTLAACSVAGAACQCMTTDPCSESCVTGSARE
jgi:hypothetical protein